MRIKFIRRIGFVPLVGATIGIVSCTPLSPTLSGEHTLEHKVIVEARAPFDLITERADSSLTISEADQTKMTGVGFGDASRIPQLGHEARAGSMEAAYALGIIYEIGDGVPKSETEASHWYRMAAKHGNASAAYRLGELYAMGAGVPQNFAEANYWYKEAAFKGVARANVRLADNQLAGKGTRVDEEGAFMNYSEAARQSDPYAEYMLSVMYLHGMGIHSSLKKSVKCYKNANKMEGNASAKYRVGKAFIAGEMLKQNVAEGLKWITKAAEQGSVAAQNELGDIYYNGLLAKKDYKAAMKWYQRAALKGSSLGQYNVGMLYYNGHGVPQNYSMAANWFKKSARQGAKFAQYRLAEMYHKGQGVKQNDVNAYGWWSISSDSQYERPHEALDKLGQSLSPEKQAEAVELADELRRLYAYNH